MENKKKKKGFPDLNKDGKVTFKDILIGRGVIKGNVGLLIKKGAEKGIKELSKSDKIKDIVEKGMKKGKDELKKSMRQATPPEPASKLRRAGDIALGSGLTLAGLTYAASEIEERDRKKARQEKETKERTETEGSFMGGGKVKKAKIGMFGKVGTNDVEGARAPYLKKRDKDRLTNKDIEEAQRNFYKERNKDLPGTEGSFMGGGMMNEDPMGYKTGGAIEVGKGKDYIKDLL